MPTKIVIVGGVTGGATAAARIRRLDEKAEIVIFERTGFIWKMLIILIPYKSGAKSGAYYDTYLLGVACNEKYNGGIF